jgi:murein DD-endopeptidase MepM/ murein hydrolase activator NlpD
LQPGDRIDVLFERAMRDGEFIGYGDIKAALVADGRHLTRRFDLSAVGKPGWFDEQGRSTSAPVPAVAAAIRAARTSRFLSPPAPVLGRERHLGVDYGAPVGTACVQCPPVSSARRLGEAGQMIGSVTAAAIQTAYCTCRRSAGIRPGARVSQGDLIGRVGAVR